MALTDHELDPVFERSDDEIRAIIARAAAAAIRAKGESQQRYRTDPDAKGATPAQAARVKFLDVLGGGAGSVVDNG